MSAGPASEDAAPAAKRSRPWVRVLRIVLTIALCAFAWNWLLAHADLHALAAQARQLPWWAWLLAGAALLTGHGMRAVRLRRDWRQVADVGWWRCLRLVLGHNALVVMLPLRSGEAGYLVAVRNVWGVGWGAAALALARWRLQDASVLLVLAAALLAPVSVGFQLLLAAGAAALLFLAMRPAWSWLSARAGAQASLPSGRGPWAGLDASIAIWGLKVLANGGLLAALAGLPLAVGWRAALGGELAGVQPFQPPAGLGTYEGGIWLAAGLPAGAEARVVAAALAVHAFSLAVALGAAALTQLLVPAGPLRQKVFP